MNEEEIKNNVRCAGVSQPPDVADSYFCDFVLQNTNNILTQQEVLQLRFQSKQKEQQQLLRQLQQQQLQQQQLLQQVLLQQQPLQQQLFYQQLQLQQQQFLQQSPQQIGYQQLPLQQQQFLQQSPLQIGYQQQPLQQQQFLQQSPLYIGPETYTLDKLSYESNQEEVSDTENVWKVEHLNSSGLAARSKLFVRNETRELWSKLNKLTKTNRMIIQGPPGIGKSTELYGWVQFQRKTKKVLYIHRIVGTGDVLLVCTPSGIDRYCLSESLPDLNNMLRRLIIYIHRKYHLDIVACDGYRREDKILFAVLAEFKDQIVIYCSSYRASSDIKGETLELLQNHHGPLVSFEMDSWTLKQYELAWKHGVFEKMFASKAMVQSHYFYSGGNMRLMLMSEQACLEVLRTSFASVTDPQLLLSGLHGQSSFSAVNTLFQCIDGEYRPVSEYVSKWLLQTFPNNSSFISIAKSVMTYNPSYRGWILKYEALDHTVNKRIELSPSSHPWNTHNGNVIYFNTVSDFANRTLPNNTLLIPNTYIYGLVDALLYRAPGHLCGLKTHIYKLKHIIPYLSMFSKNGKCKFDFHVIIPFDKCDTYKISKRHFNDKQEVLKFDSRWTHSKSAQELASVYLFDQSGRLRPEEKNETSIWRRID